MHARPRSNASMQWFLEDLAFRVVAASGIPSDRHHIGKLIHRSLMDDPKFILQIDASTGVKETGGSVLRRCIQCAIAMKNCGIKRGDVISLMTPNNMDVCIVYYACLFIGAAIAPVDINMRVKELQNLLDIQRPKIIFCLNDYGKYVKEALTVAKLTSDIVTFDESKDYTDFQRFLDKFGDDTKIEGFKPEDFDPSETFSILLMTGGTSGGVKCATLTHVSSMFGCMEFWCRQTKFPDPERIALILSPLQWISANFHYILSPILRYTRLQSPLSLDRPLIYEMINRYRPTHVTSSPPLLASLLNTEEVTNCDLSCFNHVVIAGGVLAPGLFNMAKKLMPNADVQEQYGLTEVAGFAVRSDDKLPGSLGKIRESLQFRLIEVESQKDIVGPNITGELWLKGPALFKGYYNDPEKTKEVFSEDGWLKTGDLLQMDEDYNLYYVDRLKMLLKYKNHHVSPVELENVIHQHPGVYDVAVTGVVEDLESGDLPVACVVRKPGCKVTAQEIKDLVKNNLSDTKQLRGGVIFVSQLPLTASSKIDRAKLKTIVAESKRE
ncbi:luciferin 4-monooxygenase [Amyelois transitella]|uniref:luciferin 4-monooxygenase n=1 Tax=Amyelois transitella TaxID=680683 RepID=UPI0029903DE7|nr:luciferin 4-monooxygenase [Amyelois transitella]XP_013184130.2 luciferin 4-monooxygenase [Amyelois transitella]